MDARTPILCLVSGRTDMKKVKSLRMKNELFYSLKKLKGILNYIIIITGDTVKCGVNIVIYATHTLKGASHYWPYSNYTSVVLW